jgi:hypothetical protein
MTTVSAGSSATLTLRDGGQLKITSTGGRGSVTVTPSGGTAFTDVFTGGAESQIVGPYDDGCTVVITSVSAEIVYKHVGGNIPTLSDDGSSLVDGAGNVISTAPALMTLAEMLAYAPPTDGVEVYVTDLPAGTRGRFYWHLASGKWRPAGMVLIDRSLTLDSGVNSTAEQYLKNLRIPGGLLFTGAEILFEYSLARSNTTDAGTTANFRVGNAGTIADTAFGNGSGFGGLTSTTRTNGNSHRYRVASATEIEKGGNGSTAGGSWPASGSSLAVSLWNVGSTTATLYFAPTVQLAAATGTTLPQLGYCALWLLPS